MPGPDITRPKNRITRIFLLIWVIGAGVLVAALAPPVTALPSPSQTQAEAVQLSTSQPPQSGTSEVPPSASTPQGTQSPQQSTQPQTSQQPSNDDNGTFVIRKDVDEVLLHATVVDDRQRIVTNLDKNAFSVFEDGKPQTIISFRHEDIPVAMGIVIDNSGSMREKRTKVNQAALNLVRSSNPQECPGFP